MSGVAGSAAVEAMQPSNTGTEGDLVRSDASAPRISIDYLTLVCDPSELFFEWVEENHGSGSDLRSASIDGDWDCRYSWHVPHAGHFKRERSRRYSGDQIVWSFNPNMIPPDSVEHVRDELLSPKRVTRVDVAMDYPRDLSDCRFDVPGRKREQFWSAGGRTETIAFGRRDAEWYVRVYDKALQGGLVDPLWRIEIEHKRMRGAEPLPESMFDCVTVLNWPSMDDLDDRTWMGLTVLRDHPEAERRLGSRTRKRYKAILEEHCRPLDPSPAEAYKAEHPALSAYLEDILN